MVLILFLICLIGIDSINAGLIHEDNDAIHSKSFHGKTEKFAEKRCLANGNLKQLEQLLKELKEVRKCIVKILPKDEDNLTEQCFESRKEVIKCLQRLMDLLTPCLPDEEKYLTDFVMESYEGYSDYFCRHIDILTPMGLLESNMAQCVNRLQRNPELSPRYLCYEFIKLSNHSDTSPITKDELCRDLDIIYDCYETVFKEECPDAPKAWEFESGLLNGLRSPCTKHRKNQAVD